MKTKIVEVRNLFCMICEDKVSSILSRIEGVIDHKTNVYTKEIYMKYDPKKIKYSEILKILNAGGFVTSITGEVLRKDLALILLFLVYKIHWLYFPLSNILLSLVTSSVFQYFNIQAILRNKSFNKNFLVLLSSFLCYLLGVWVFITEEFEVLCIEYHSLSIDIFSYVLLSSMLLSFIVKLSKVNLYSISQIKRTLVKRLTSSKGFEEVEMEKIIPGDVIYHKEGYVYFDGRVIQGECLVDESDILGEDCLKPKTIDENILSSTKIISGEILLKVEGVGKNSYTGKILSLIENSSFKDIFRKNRNSALYTFLVLICSFLISLIYYLRHCEDDEELWLNIFKMFISSMISLCPCVFIISEPLIALKARKYLLSHNIVVNNYSPLFTKQPKILFIDKTGTLTKGYCEVLTYKIFSNVEENKSIILKMEEEYQRTVYGSIYRLLKGSVDPSCAINGLSYTSGCGLKCFYKSREVRLGKKEFVSNNHRNSSLEKYFKKEKIVYFSIQSKVEGYFVLSDNINPTAYKMVEDLKKMFSKVCILSGDQKKNVRKVSQSLNIPDYFYEQTSREKLCTILNAGCPSLMIGDGTNDIPSFRASNLSISVNLENTGADVVLLSNDLNDVVTALKYFSRMYNKNLVNYFFAVIYNILILFFIVHTQEDMMVCSMAISLTFILLNSLLI